MRARPIREHPLKPRGSAAMVVVFLFTASFGARGARGEEPPLPVLRLSDVLEEALRANPGLQAARGRASAARAEPARVSSYDDPVVSWEAWNTPDRSASTKPTTTSSSCRRRFRFPESARSRADGGARCRRGVGRGERDRARSRRDGQARLLRALAEPQEPRDLFAGRRPGGALRQDRRAEVRPRPGLAARRPSLAGRAHAALEPREDRDARDRRSARRAERAARPLTERSLGVPEPPPPPNAGEDRRRVRPRSP